MSRGRVHAKGRWLAILFALVLSLVLVATAFAGGIDVKAGDVQGTMFAPSVVWGGTNAHVIVKLTNKGSQPVDVDGNFAFPEGKDTQFTYGTKATAPPKEGVAQSLKGLKPGESKYIAFTYVTPKVSAPLGSYTSKVTLKAGTATQTIPWTFDVREGTRFQPQTDAIVYLLYGVSGGMLVFWFIYFMGFVNRSFKILDPGLHEKGGQ